MVIDVEIVTKAFPYTKYNICAVAIGMTNYIIHTESKQLVCKYLPKIDIYHCAMHSVLYAISQRERVDE